MLLFVILHLLQLYAPYTKLFNLLASEILVLDDEMMKSWYQTGNSDASPYSCLLSPSCDRQFPVLEVLKRNN